MPKPRAASSGTAIDRQREVSNGAKTKIDEIREQFSDEQLKQALEHYEEIKNMLNTNPEKPRLRATIEEVAESSAGIEGWLNCAPETHKTEDEKAAIGLNGLWEKRSMLASMDVPEWEKVTLTVDSGASDTVVPPSVARFVELLSSPKVGIEYEVANGGVLMNLGEKRCEIRTSANTKNTFLMSFQVVEVHKPLLAVSKVIEAGHQVNFGKDSHILLSTGEKVPIRCTGGTYEVDIWIKNPGFSRPSGN